MRTEVPPNLFRIIDTLGFDQQLNKVFVFSPTRKVVGNIGAGKFVEYFAAIRFQPGIHPKPERRIGG